MHLVLRTYGKMRVLHVEAGVNAGGQEYRTLIEAQWLNAMGHQGWIACNPDSAIFQEALISKIPAFPLAMESGFSPISTWQLYQIARKLRCDVIHTHGSKDSWIVVPLQLMGMPVVRSRHITSLVGTNLLSKFCYRYGCEHIVATAEVIRKGLVENNRISREKITVVGEGVKLEQFHPGVDGFSFRSLWNVQPEDIVFGCVAMLRYEKGQEFFIRAAARMWEQVPNARFVIIGDNAYAESHRQMYYRNLVQEIFGYDPWRPTKHICLSRRTPLLMHGHEVSIAEAIAALDIVVVPSLQEAQSRVVPEALCLGKPVIASRVGGLPEVVEHEKTGLLILPGDVEALAEAMIRLVNDSLFRSKLITTVIEMNKKQFSLDIQMAKTLQVYEKAIRNRKTA